MPGGGKGFTFLLSVVGSVWWVTELDTVPAEGVGVGKGSWKCPPAGCAVFICTASLPRRGSDSRFVSLSNAE